MLSPRRAKLPAPEASLEGTSVLAVPVVLLPVSLEPLDSLEESWLVGSDAPHAASANTRTSVSKLAFVQRGRLPIFVPTSFSLSLPGGCMEVVASVQSTGSLKAASKTPGYMSTMRMRRSAISSRLSPFLLFHGLQA